MKNYYQHLKSIDDWKNLLSRAEEHWVDGKSAKEIAKLWTRSDGAPDSVKALFPNSDIEPIFLFPEYKVRMPGKGGSSCNDLYIYATTPSDIWVIMVEAKENEFFDEIVEKWYEEKKKENGGENAVNRLTEIQNILELNKIDKPPYDIIGKLRTQLFHRTASAVIEAKRVGAKKALVLIQSFGSKDRTENYQDFVSFLSLFSVGELVQKSKLIGPVKLESVELHFAWIDYL